ncbi:MAG: tetratricopeptide repeat protein [Planctomycetota bacterium]
MVRPGAHTWQRFACALLVFVVTLCAFWPAYSAEFVDWDDGANFITNYAFRGLSSEHLQWMFTTTHMGPYQPLSWLSLAVDYELFGLDPHAFHRTNVLLHALAAVACYQLAHVLLALVRLRSGASEVAANGPATLFAATFAALFFAVHPLRCESVAWVTERRDVLSGLFYLASVGAYVSAAGAQHPGRRRVLAFVLYVLGLLSKASGMTLPLVLLLLDAWPLGRWTHSPEERRRALLEKLAFALPALVVAWIAVLGQASAGTALRSLAQHGALERAAQAAYAACFYPWKTLLPADLLPIYELPRPFVATEARFLACAFLTIAITIAAIVLRVRAPGFSVAWLAYGVLLAPVSGLAQAGTQLVADRYSYLPCVPLAVLAAAALLQWSVRVPRHALYALQLGGGALLVLAILTFQQTRIWRTSESLWTHTLERSPDSANALQNLGATRLRTAVDATDATERRRLLETAAMLFERGLQVAPDEVFWLNRGLVFVLRSEDEPARAPELLEQARASVERGITLAREHGRVDPVLSMHLASILMKLGRNDEALPLLEQFVSVEPNHVLGRRLLGAALMAANRPRDAIPHFEHALTLEPNDAMLWLRLAKAHETAGNREAADTASKRADALQHAPR